MIAVEPLARHPRFVAPLVAAFAAEWPEWAQSVGPEAIARCFEPGPAGALPEVLVAFEGDTLLGTIALRAFFAEAPQPETPWVRQLLVLPGFRGKGVDRALERALEAAAQARGYPRIYAATTRIERLMARRGWHCFRRIEHQGEPMAWLWKDLSR